MKSKIPKFKSLEEERNFWDTHSVTDYLDELKSVKVKFTKPKKKLISLRLETPQIEALKAIASRKGLGYLSRVACLKFIGGASGKRVLDAGSGTSSKPLRTPAQPCQSFSAQLCQFVPVQPCQPVSELSGTCFCD